MVVIEKLSKRLQLGDQKLGQTTKRIKVLKRKYSNKEHKLFYGKTVLRLIRTFSLVLFLDGILR